MHRTTSLHGQQETYRSYTWKSTSLSCHELNLHQGAEDLADDGSKFLIEKWERDASDPNAGYGITSVMEGGSLLEKVLLDFTSPEHDASVHFRLVGDDEAHKC